MKNKKILTVLLLMLLVLTIVSGCSVNSAGIASVGAQEAVMAQAAWRDERTITVVGRGVAFGEPDQAQVSLGVEIFAKEVDQATSQNEEVLQRIMAALAEQGIAAQDIRTVNYGLWAEQIYGDKGPEGIAGYRVSNQVNATVRDIGNVGQVLAAVIDAGANSINGVNFNVADTEALEEQARGAAMDNARRRASTLSGLAGAELGDIKLVSEVVDQPVYPLPGTGGGALQDAAVPSIAPGQLSYEVQVQVTFFLE